MTHSDTLTSYVIRSAFDSNVIWAKNRSDLKLRSTDIHIWRINGLENFHSLFKKYRYVLNQEEFNKAKAFHWADDFKRYLTGRIALKILLGKYLSKQPSDIQLQFHNRKPSVFSDTPLKYNLSYTDNQTLISIGLCETGIDVERIKSDFDFTEILSTCFSNEEIETIGKNRKSREEFFLHWTRKEALLKYTGQGLINDLTIVPSLNGTHKSVSKRLKIETDVNLLSFKLNTECVASLAYPNSISTVKYFEWQQLST